MATIPLVYQSNLVETDHAPIAPLRAAAGEIHWAGYEFYAMFDDQAHLLSCVGWQHFLSGPQVHNPAFLRSVANDAAYYKPTYVITGPLAGLLWTAWHGRLRDQQPQHATAQTAIAARLMIHFAHPSPAKDLVRKALDDLGHVIWDDPDYDRLVPIPPEMMEMLP